MIGQNLLRLMLEATRGNQREFARVSGIPHTTIRSWIHYSKIPRLSDILQLGYMSHAHPSDLLFGNPVFHFEPARASHNLTRRVQITVIPPATIENALANALTEWPPVTIRDLAVRLGINDERIRMLFPEMYAQLVKRGREYKASEAKARRTRLFEKVKQAVIAIHAQGDFPSAKRVGYYLRFRLYRANPELFAAFVEARTKIGLPLSQK